MGRLHDLLDQAADDAPRQSAVEDAETSWDYAELRAMSQRSAGWLTDRGVRPGDRVVVKSPDSARLAAMVFGTSMAGAVLVPLSSDMTPFHFRQIVEDADPVVVLTLSGTDLEPASRTRTTELAIDAVWQETVSGSAGTPSRCPCTSRGGGTTSSSVAVCG